DDIASSGHLRLEDLREKLYYMRLIEHEMPKLVAFRKPFVPPTDETPIIVRSIDYGGEEHPATAKRVITAAVDSLPLRDEKAIHKFKLIAGPRWTPDPPRDSGMSKDSEWGNGVIKISCDDFDRPAQNLNWARATLQRLVTEANKYDRVFGKMPVDLRHVYAKRLKERKGDHLRGRIYFRPTSRDFPARWLP
ncbi:hypothetical protein FISHEDRAFT_16226, partial [Fistulina hepatica ATCC 64428]